MSVYRCFTQRKAQYDTEVKLLQQDIKKYLGISNLDSVQLLNRYDIEGISPAVYNAARITVFADAYTHDIYDGSVPDLAEGAHVIIVEPLPGQFDQRADACEQCLRMLSSYTDVSKSGTDSGTDFARGAGIIVKCAKMYVFYGKLNDGDLNSIRNYLINPVESREASPDFFETLAALPPKANPVAGLRGFITADDAELNAYLSEYSLAMDSADLRFLRDYFRDAQKRDPTIAELRVVDTYWSDHCRHTTFSTHFSDVKTDNPAVEAAYKTYLETRRFVYGDDAAGRAQTLMDLATLPAKAMIKQGKLTNIELSEEVNACSVHIDVNVSGKTEDWLLMFKNETHNHPTEAEPFGGAATCIGGAIRDPMSGRSHVYQAMRVTGSGDPLAGFADTLPGKIPQRKLTRTAASGYCSYGNQIGVASGLVQELYHPGYAAKRMELGAVVAAVKAENIRRETPIPGDKVMLIGGRTGRDGIGGATGSSKSADGKTITSMAAEVQKGNAAEERKIQRLFLDPAVSKMIKKCNDFGAGGVSVAVGELADGLDIDLSLVRRKYEGLDGTEIAISESQERMAVVVSPEDAEKLIQKAEEENLECYVIADVTSERRVVIRHEGDVIVDLSRDFLSTNGAVKNIQVMAAEPPAATPKADGNTSAIDALRALAGDLRCCSQQGLQNMFDDTAGGGTVLVKNGGITQSTPVQSMAALIPVREGETTTASVMAYGYDPYISSADPFYGAKSAVVMSVAKLVASGCDPDFVHLTFQEYFERLGDDPLRWGKPFSALLGAFEAQMELEIAAIGGKDSMSGSWGDLNVPPALVSFAIAPNDSEYIISPEFKEPSHDVVLWRASDKLSDTKKTWKRIRELIEYKAIVSAWAVTGGGIAEGIFKMALGNEIGFRSADGFNTSDFFEFMPGSIIAEVTREVPDAELIGRTIPEPAILLGGESLSLSELRAVWENTLEQVFPAKTDESGDIRPISSFNRSVTSAAERFAKPRVLVFAFPGTNGELDAARAVSLRGGEPKTFVVRNMTDSALAQSAAAAVGEIEDSQILLISGGYAFGDEPDGAAKLIELFFRNPYVADAIHKHIKERDGLILGICEGFQALVRLGLVPFGEILPPGSGEIAFTGNAIGRYQSKYCYTRVSSVHSPWMNLLKVGDVHAVPVSHATGRLTASDAFVLKLAESGRIATQYTDSAGIPSMDISVNPDGSAMAIEGMFSPDGRVFGKMGRTDRCGVHIAKNIYGDKNQPVIESGIRYFK